MGCGVLLEGAALMLTLQLLLVRHLAVAILPTSSLTTRDTLLLLLGGGHHQP